MRPCLLTPPAPGDLECLLNQWTPWEGMTKRESAGGLCRCLECREGVLILKKAAMLYEVKPKEPRPPSRWTKRDEGWRPQAGTPVPPGTPALPEFLRDATPAVRRAYLREAAHGRQ